MSRRGITIERLIQLMERTQRAYEDQPELLSIKQTQALLRFVGDRRVTALCLPCDDPPRWWHD